MSRDDNYDSHVHAFLLIRNLELGLGLKVSFVFLGRKSWKADVCTSLPPLLTLITPHCVVFFCHIHYWVCVCFCVCVCVCVCLSVYVCVCLVCGAFVCTVSEFVCVWVCVCGLCVSVGVCDCIFVCVCVCVWVWVWVWVLVNLVFVRMLSINASTRFYGTAELLYEFASFLITWRSGDVKSEWLFMQLVY